VSEYSLTICKNISLYSNNFWKCFNFTWFNSSSSSNNNFWPSTTL